MTALDVLLFLKEHWFEIVVVLSVLPPVLRAALHPAPGSSLDRGLSRYEAMVFDVRKLLKSFGLALPGAPPPEALSARGPDTDPAPPPSMSDAPTQPITIEIPPPSPLPEVK